MSRPVGFATIVARSGPEVDAYEAWLKRLEERYPGHAYVNIVRSARAIEALDATQFSELTDAERDRLVDAAIARMSRASS